MDRPSDFTIMDCGDYFTIVNIKANDFDNFHTHIRKKGKGKTDTCDMLIKLICNKNIPRSKYLRTSAKRISRDEKYIQNICVKEEKDLHKQKFHKVNNGRF